MEVAYGYICHKHHHGFLVDKFGDIDLTSWSKEEDKASYLQSKDALICKGVHEDECEHVAI